MSDVPFLPGLVYSESLARDFGLAAETTTLMEAPLLGSALDLSRGLSGGHVCDIHLFLQEGSDVRLPDQSSLKSVSASVNRLPYSFLKKPGAELKELLGSQVRLLANRAMVRFGSGRLTGDVVASEDSRGSYVSLPLNEYDKALLPGVMWLSIPINCALAAEKTYDNVTIFFEKESSPNDMIVNQFISPEKMTSVNIPMALFNGMRDDLELALTRDSQNSASRSRIERFRIFSD